MAVANATTQPAAPTEAAATRTGSNRRVSSSPAGRPSDSGAESPASAGTASPVLHNGDDREGLESDAAVGAGPRHTSGRVAFAADDDDDDDGDHSSGAPSRGQAKSFEGSEQSPRRKPLRDSNRGGGAKPAVEITVGTDHVNEAGECVQQ